MYGLSASRTLPTTWVHIWSVARVGSQASSGSAGQCGFCSVILGLLFARLASAYPHAADAARRSRRRSASILQRSAADGELPFSVLAQGIETPRPGAGEGQVEEHKAEQDREIAAIEDRQETPGGMSGKNGQTPSRRRE